ncbi:MAG: hypothetical protein EOO14_17980 [Chitinophagaceae bacterium]|nr:MAG: hypothetical protein EOO14_17980 [Chitinophagaceae bacterium]
MTRQILTAGAILFLGLAACRKEADNPPPLNNDPQEDLPHYLLRSIEWDNGMKALPHYNSDSTVSYTTFFLGSAGGEVVYEWNGKRLEAVYDSRSLYTNRFVYDDKGRLTAINHTRRQGQPTVSYTLEYSYDNNNRLKTLLYYRVNEAGKQLQETNTYQYNAEGYPETIITLSGGSVITRRIEAYSGRLRFDYSHFISASLSEHYSFYNFPLLRQLDRLPAKVTKLLKTGAAAEKVEQVTETTYTITNHRLDKTVTRLTYPEHPDLNQEQETVYGYD